jgi:hypothetical protein
MILNGRTFISSLNKAKVQMEGEVTKIIRKVALSVDQAVVLATPVDKGRARGNWIVSRGSPEKSETGKLDKSGAGALSQGRSVIGGAQFGEIIWISNNVPYIGRLNEGSSKQAPSGFVEKAIQAGVEAVDGARIEIE